LHGLTEDKDFGGHDFDFKIVKASLRFEIIKQIKMDLKLV